MKKEVNITIFSQEETDLNYYVESHKDMFGTEFSLRNEIALNPINNGYSIIYTDENFNGMNYNDFFNSLYNILNSIDDSIYVINIYYIPLDDIYSKTTVEYIKKLVMTLKNINDSRFQLGNIYLQEEDSEDDIEDDEELEIENGLDEMLNTINKKDKKKKKKYFSSLILKSAKNPKKTTKRHGILVCNNKKMFKRDRKTIKEFIQDFIPGKSDWIKDFREELLKRWINNYTMSKKKFAKINKEWKKSTSSNLLNKFGEKAVHITRSLLGDCDDNWNNPDR